MGRIIIVDLNLQRINQEEAGRRQRRAATTGECSGGQRGGRRQGVRWPAGMAVMTLRSIRQGQPSPAGRRRAATPETGTEAAWGSAEMGGSGWLSSPWSPFSGHPPSLTPPSLCSE